MDWTRIPPLERGVHLFRVDYGYPDPPLPWAASWPTWDLALTERAVGAVMPWDADAPHARRGILKNADRLLAWGRGRSGDDPLGEMARSARSHAWVLLCRFLRHFCALAKALIERGVTLAVWETERDGSLPPLYRSLAPDSPLTRLHLELEWISALACARGDTALERIGAHLARMGPSRCSALAAGLGISPGAARSYLSWMEDVALVRREGRLFDLVHPALGRRFLTDTQSPEPHSPTPPRREDTMSVD